ncbi:MAG: efflux RND transporter permease subunit [Deltaproteobacteria bacterium]|nr:MAG: efflux RND transporter permease subunit [Deltaproteobacteria bacterium]
MSWIVRRPIFVAVIFIMVSLFGLVSFSRLPIDMMPEIEPPVLSVITIYPGASAGDVEQKVTENLEEALGGLAGVEEIRSASRENLSLVTLKFAFGSDLDQAANDIRQSVEFVRNQLPKDIEDPRIFKFDTSKFPIMVFAVTSSVSDIRLEQQLVDDLILEPIRHVKGVGQVMVFNAPPLVVRVDVFRDRLLAHGLTMTEIVRVIGSENMTVPVGSVDVGAMEFAVRMPNEAQSIEELGAIVLTRDRDGTPVHLDDLASLSEGINDSTELATVDGKVVVVGGIMKMSGENSIEVAEAAKAKLAAVQDRLPEGMDITIVTDTSEFVVDMIGNLKRTVAIGGVLVVLVAILFLRRLRPSLIVATTIPASMIVTFLMLYLAGMTLNVITLMAMALAIGMVVDNGIVVLENITRLVDEGMDPYEAAADGTKEVGGALLASTSTTLVIFAPLVFITGLIGIMFGQLAYVMIVTIAGSLVVSLTLTPVLAALLVKRHKGETTGRVFSRLESIYRWSLGFSLRHTWMVFAASAGSIVLTGLLVLTVPTDFMPKQDSGEFQITLELPVGTNLDTTADVAQRVIDSLNEEPEVELIYTRAGTSSSGMGALTGGKEGANVATVTVKLVSANYRSRSDEQIARSVLDRIGPMPEVVNVEINLGSTMNRMLGLGGKPVSVEVVGNDFTDLQQVARELRTQIAAIDGTVDVAADILQTRPEVRLGLSRELAGRAGVPFALAGGEMRAALTGMTAGRYTGGSEPKDIVVRLALEDRDEIDELFQVPVRSMSGSLIALGDVLTETEGEAAIEIKRVDKQRIVTVSAGIEGRALGDVAAEVDDILNSFEAPAGTIVRYGGAVEEQRESFKSMFLLMGLGMLLVYLVMAAQFESWLDPVVILFSIPFAVTGAFFALAITRTTLSVTAFLGLIILIGVVVNNAIVLVDYVKLLQSRGMDRTEALVTGGSRRLRPVLMTTMTTVGGMFPLALASGRGAEMWGPMGRTALGGLVMSTVVTLILVPVAYSVVDRFRDWISNRGKVASVDFELADQPATAFDKAGK